MNDIRRRLDLLGAHARDKATWAHLVEKGYTVHGAPGDADPEAGSGGLEELTLARYLETDNFLDTNYDYKVTRGLEVWNHVHSEHRWVESAFGEHGHADLSAVYDLKNRIARAAAKLYADPRWAPTSAGAEPPATGFGGATGREALLLVDGMDQLSHWTGTAANALRDVFGADGGNWALRLHADFVLLVALIAALEARIQLVYTTRHGVVGLGETLIDALDVVSVTGCGSDPSVPLAVLGPLSAIGFAAEFPLATPTAGAVSGAVIAVGDQVIEAMASGDQDPGVAKDKDLTLDGDTVSDVLSSFSDHMATIAGDYRAREGEIADGLSGLYGDCVAHRNQDFEIDFGGEAPFVGATPDNMYHPDRLGASDVTVDPDELTTAAGEFATAAELVLAVGADIAATNESNLDGLSFHRDVAASADPLVDGIRDGWCDLRDLARDVLAHNGGIVRHTARILVWAATDYPATDDAGTRKFRDAVDTLDATERTQP